MKALLIGATGARGKELLPLLLADSSFSRRAGEVWQKLLLIDATHPDALYGLGLIAVQDKNLTLAKSYLQQLQASHPNTRQALLLEQDILLQDPAKEALLNEARVLVESEEPVKAANAYIRLLEGRPMIEALIVDVDGDKGVIARAVAPVGLAGEGDGKRR